MGRGISWLVCKGKSKAYGYGDQLVGLYRGEQGLWVRGSAGWSVQGRARLMGKGISWLVCTGEGKAYG